jgi:hypothetical protein
MVHTIKIFVLYVGIIVEIQEHTYDHCTERVSGHVYIYPNPLGHTLKSFASLEYEFGRDKIKREGYSDSGLGKSPNGSIISQNVLEGSETLMFVYRKVSEEIWSNRSIYGKSGISWKFKPQR